MGPSQLLLPAPAPAGTCHQHSHSQWEPRLNVDEVLISSSMWHLEWLCAQTLASKVPPNRMSSCRASASGSCACGSGSLSSWGGWTLPYLLCAGPWLCSRQTSQEAERYTHLAIGCPLSWCLSWTYLHSPFSGCSDASCRPPWLGPRCPLPSAEWRSQ